MVLACFRNVNILLITQVDADYKLQDLKRSYKELEMKGKGYNKRLNDLQMAIVKHLEQYVGLFDIKYGDGLFFTLEHA